MIDLMQRLLPFWLAAAGLGFALGALLGGGRRAFSTRWPVLLAAILALIVGSGLAMSGLIPGRPDLWLDISMLLAVPYGLGCAAGAGLRWAAGWGRGPEEPAPSSPPAPSPVLAETATPTS